MNFSDFISTPIFQSEEVKITWIKLLTILILILANIFILKLTRRALRKLEERQAIDEGSLYSIFQIIKYFLWIIAFGFILNILGFNLTLMIASSAALLVGLGLGIQNIFNDYISGILILIEHNVKVGDIMEIENEKVGRVLTIGLRTSKIKTRDDIIVIIPNSKLISENTINWTNMTGKARFHVNVGVAYGSDTDLVKKTLLYCAAQNKDVENKPEPFVRFNDFGDSSLDFQLFFWTSKMFFVENIKSDMRFVIDNEFRKHGIQIPFPQRDVHIK